MGFSLGECCVLYTHTARVPPQGYSSSERAPRSLSQVHGRPGPKAPTRRLGGSYTRSHAAPQTPNYTRGEINSVYRDNLNYMVSPVHWWCLRLTRLSLDQAATDGSVDENCPRKADSIASTFVYILKCRKTLIARCRTIEYKCNFYLEHTLS